MKLLLSLGPIHTLSEVIHGLTQGEPTHKGFCLTFDDGYENNATVAAPILEQLGIPATFFLTTGFLDGTTNLWVDRFESSLASCPGPELKIKLEDEPVSFNLSTPEHRRATDQKLRNHLKQQGPLVRDAIINEIERRSPSSPHSYPLHAPMTWQQAHGLVYKGFEIGAHTVTHPILSRLTSDAQHAEIANSKQRIETELGIHCSNFAYPNGQPNDWTSETLTHVKNAGFVSCLTTIDGEIKTTEGPYSIRRTTIDTNSLLKFFMTVTGARKLLNQLKY